jgi:hypothetical protein
MMAIDRSEVIFKIKGQYGAQSSAYTLNLEKKIRDRLEMYSDAMVAASSRFWTEAFMFGRSARVEQR